MPTYEFTCPNGHDFEKFFRTISGGASEFICPVCGALATRKISAGAGLMFKGSGFYITDYGKDGKKDQNPSRKSSSGSSSEGASSSSSSEGGSSDSKSSESKGGENKSSESKSSDSKPSEPKSVESKPAAPKLAESKPSSTKSSTSSE